MPRSLFRVIALWVVAFAFAILAKSAGSPADQPVPWNSPHFSIDPKALYSAASEATPPEGTDVTVLDEEDALLSDANGQLTHTGYMIYKVLTQKGVEGWDRISQGWQPWRAERPIIRARVISPDFAVHELDPKTISDAPAREDAWKVYTDQRVVRAPLPAIAPGSVVECEWVSVLKPDFPGGGTVGFQFFGRFEVPVQHRRVVLDSPSSLPVQFGAERLPDVNPKRSEAEGRVKTVFESGPLAALDKPEPYLASGMGGAPTLTYSTDASWQEVADGYAQIVEAPLRAAEVKSLVERLTQGKSSRNEKEQAILEFLDKEIRYTGIEFGENTIIPHSTAETLTRKYGDCKDKTLLLVAMLRAAGIPAFMALLDVRGQLGVLPSVALPGVGFFNHAVVYVPDDYYQWIDPTDEYARLGQLPITDQGRLALIVRAGTQAPVLTPEDPSQANGILTVREIHLTENGPARIVETIQPRGCIESSYRRYYTDRQNEQTRQALTIYMKALYLADKLDRWDRSDPADLSRPFEVVLESGKAKRAFTDLESAGAAIRFDGLFSLLPLELQKRDIPEGQSAGAAKPTKKRTADYLLPEAFATEWQYKITPPLGFKPAPLPKDVKLELGPALLTEEFSADLQGEVHAVIRFDTKKRRFTVAEATELRNRVAELAAGEAILIKFQPLGRVLQEEGKMRESFQAYHDLIAQHPKEAVHHLQLAQALLESGMGEAARNEARLAVKLEPYSALAEKTLANILEYDLVGRKMRSGSDYVRARAAFREAERLDPEDKTITSNFAILLEYNEDGLRYGPGAKMHDAVAEYRKLTPEQVASMGLRDNLAYALFYAGEFAECHKNAETLNPQPKALMVACEAAQNGSEAGITEAGKRATGDVELRQTLKAAGEMLVRIRKYSLAADLLQAGAVGDEAARTMGLAAVLRKARLHEEVQFRNDPKDLVMHTFLLSTDPNLTVEKLMGVSSRNAQVVLKNTDPEETRKGLNVISQLRHQAAHRGLSMDYTLDLALPFIEPKGEGNDAVGYREKVQTPGGQQLTYFVVKEGAQYRILDTTLKPSAIGLEILDRVAAHDSDGARVLLDWMRDEQHLSGGDDPVSGLAFPRFWAKGREADARQMRLAAAAILVQAKPTVQQGLSILEEAKKTASSDLERTNIYIAMQSGYSLLDDFENLLPVSSDLAKQYPESATVFYSESYALRGLGRFADAEALAQQRLKRLPDDVDALKALEWNAVAQENYRLAYELGQKLVAAGKADASDLNMSGWLTLFFDRPGGPDIETALKSSQLGPNDFHTLHTLGCLYAEAGKTKEAYGVLIQAMDLENLDEPDSDFWYAFGRIAEQYGEREIARSDYAKVTKPKRSLDIPDSSYRLAQIRLAKIPQSPAANDPGERPNASHPSVVSAPSQAEPSGGEGGQSGNEDDAYMAAVRKRISGNWQVSEITPSIVSAPVVYLVFEIRRDGAIENAQITRSSGIAEVDRSALQAVQASSPLPRLPPYYSGGHVRVKLYFDYRRRGACYTSQCEPSVGFSGARGETKGDGTGPAIGGVAASTGGCREPKACDQLNEGIAAFRTAQFQASIMHFKEAVRLDPSLINARLYLATAYGQQYVPGGDSEENVKIAEQAIDAFEDVLKMDPNNSPAIASIGNIYFNMHKFDKAKEYQRRRLQLEPNNPEPYYWIAVLDWTDCYARTGQLRKDLKLNFPKDPKQPDRLPPLPDKARADLEKDNGPLVKEGLDALEKAIELKPNDFSAMAYLNLMYRQKAELEADPDAREADLKTAEDWTDKALAIRKATNTSADGGPR